MRPLALLAASLGGGLWLATLAAGTEFAATGGLALLLVACGAASTTLASQPWLKAIAGAGAALLAWGVYEVGGQMIAADTLRPVLGGMALVLVVVSLVRSSGNP